MVGEPTFVKSVTIANGASLSPSVVLRAGTDDKGYDLPTGCRLFGIVMPAAWTAANLTFQVSHDGVTTWNNLYDANGNEVTITASTSRYIALDPVVFAGVQFLKVRSGTSGTAVNQGQEVILQLILRAI